MFGLKSTESGDFIRRGIPFDKLRVIAPSNEIARFCGL